MPKRSSRPAHLAGRRMVQLAARLAPPPGWGGALGERATDFARMVHVCAVRLSAVKPKGAGVAAAVALVAGAAIYGTVKGEHVPALVASLKDMRDATANAAGFRIDEVVVSGRKKLTEREVLAAAGVTERTSLLFLDVDDARVALEATPWVAQATVRKFYPSRLEIILEERAPFAFWQNSGKVSVIAADGTVLGPLGEREVPALPLVVGIGANAHAREIVELVDRYPVIKEQFRAAIRVADRRWNIRLKNGMDVRLPEADEGKALDLLIALDRDRKLMTRDITSIDLRLTDRVTVRLSEEAAQAREQADKEKKKKAKGGPA